MNQPAGPQAVSEDEKRDRGFKCVAFTTPSGHFPPEEALTGHVTESWAGCLVATPLWAGLEELMELAEQAG
jgi:hypothetical protein